jgi:hypothetical protein
VKDIFQTFNATPTQLGREDRPTPSIKFLEEKKKFYFN